MFFTLSIISPVCLEYAVDFVFCSFTGYDSFLALIRIRIGCAFILSVCFALLVKITNWEVHHMYIVDRKLFPVMWISFADLKGFRIRARVVVSFIVAIIKSVGLAFVVCSKVRHRHILDGEVPWTIFTTTTICLFFAGLDNCFLACRRTIGTGTFLTIAESWSFTLFFCVKVRGVYVNPPSEEPLFPIFRPIARVSSTVSWDLIRLCGDFYSRDGCYGEG